MADIGVLGLGVMGSNLALNIEDHGFEVAVWNLETEVTEQFVAANPAKRFAGTRTLEEFVTALERPRRILIMITAGKPVDMTLEKLGPLLDPDDIVIDGGNTWFPETRRREAEQKKAGIHFVGMGVSGGEEGARHGPSLMPGGTAHAWQRLAPILEAIAATTDAGPCVTHVGPDGAGHFVKMVHNGIEYGDMQLIAELYDIIGRGLGLPAPEIGSLFGSWNEGPLESFLMEISARILHKAGADGAPLVDQVLDRAGQKGTGRWTVSMAIEMGVAVPTIAAAVDARILSSLKEQRVAAAKKLGKPGKKSIGGDREKFLQAAHDALLFGRICAYAQGLSLITAGSDEYEWKIDPGEVARIWKGGCIIRSALLDPIRTAYSTRRKPANLLVTREFAKITRSTHRAARKVAAAAQSMGIPIPALGSTLAYYDSYRTADLPQNLTQAQRDAFGAHTYRRKDDPDGDSIHTDWLG